MVRYGELWHGYPRHAQTLPKGPGLTSWKKILSRTESCWKVQKDTQALQRRRTCWRNTKNPWWDRWRWWRNRIIRQQCTKRSSLLIHSFASVKHKHCMTRQVQPKNPVVGTQMMALMVTTQKVLHPVTTNIPLQEQRKLLLSNFI